MDSLFHFVFPVIAALAAKVHVKHKIESILLAGFLAVLIDLDHFIGVERASFHNIFVTILFPLAIIFLAFNFKSKYNFKGFSILLLVFLSSHTFIDMFGNPGIALFYPLSNNYYLLNFELSVPLKTNFSKSLEEGYIVSNLGLSILLYFILIILPCLFLDDIIEIMEKKHESFKRVIKEKFNLRLLSKPEKQSF